MYIHTRATCGDAKRTVNHDVLRAPWGRTRKFLNGRAASPALYWREKWIHMEVYSLLPHLRCEDSSHGNERLSQQFLDQKVLITMFQNLGCCLFTNKNNNEGNGIKFYHEIMVRINN